MIAWIKGTAISEDVLKNGDIGYKIKATNVFEKGEKYELFIYTKYSETAVDLYGFSNEDEQKTFEALIKVNGVGPVAAMNILSRIGMHDFLTAVKEEDAKTISKAPGVGAASAKKIISFIKLSDDLQSKATASDSNKQDVFDALNQLGYSETEAEKAWSKVDTTKDLGEQVLEALDYLRN